ncbi:Hypothetical protein A7982_08880 [Minicystis rosea]|nr:Hypothetical protein A7982_08880 [Minicystis rosea]
MSRRTPMERGDRGRSLRVIVPVPGAAERSRRPRASLSSPGLGSGL